MSVVPSRVSWHNTLATRSYQQSVRSRDTTSLAVMTTRTSKSKTETNATLLKSLLKLPGNKYCCDCKTADHPRWASWNLGIFLCIRCSGIHRSMGTHISRVKSVDLDAWTDEQTQSMVRWGNKKANIYWESKLEAAHVPSEGKIDNFVKTKYVSRRWISQDERPDPEDLSDDDADLPAQQTTVRPDTKESKSSAHTAQRFQKTSQATAAVRSQPAPVDSLLGLDFEAPSPIYRQESAKRPEVPAAAAAQQSSSPAITSNLSLLSNPSAGISTPAVQSSAPRNDLKMSIMSLYASAPKPQQYAQAPSQQTRMQPTVNTASSQPVASRNASAFDDLNGLFGGMNVSAAAQPQPQRSQFVSLPTQSFANKSYPAATASQQQPLSFQQTANADDSWGADDDAWGGFQGHQTSSTSTTKPSSAFDDLYSTSDVWK